MPRCNFRIVFFKHFFIILPQNCDNQDLRVATSRSGYPMKRTLPFTEDFCLIMSKMRKVCKNKHRKKAFEESYKHDTPLPNGAKLNCSIVEGTDISAGCHIDKLKHTEIPRCQADPSLPDERKRRDSFLPKFHRVRSCESCRRGA